MILHGRNIILSINGTAFAAAKSCELSLDCEDIEVSSATTGAWQSFIPGRKYWSMTFSHLVENLANNKLLVGQTVTVRMSIRGKLEYVEGTAIVKQWRVTGTVGNLTQGSFALKGTGILNAVGAAS